MSELVGILEKTAVPQELQNAQKYLENAAQTNLPLFLKELSKGKSHTLLFHLCRIVVYFMVNFGRKMRINFEENVRLEII